MLLFGLIVAIVAILAALIISFYNIFINPVIKKEVVSAVVAGKSCDEVDNSHHVTLDCEGHQQQLYVSYKTCCCMRTGAEVNIMRVTRKNNCVKFKLQK